MEQERLDAIRARCAAATAGPWGVSGEHGYFQVGPSAGGGWTFLCLQADARGNERAQEDCDFAAHARQDVPDLLAEVERLNAVLNNEDGALTRHLLTHWPAERVRAFAAHLLGDRVQQGEAALAEVERLNVALREAQARVWEQAAEAVNKTRVPTAGTTSTIAPGWNGACEDLHDYFTSRAAALREGGEG